MKILAAIDIQQTQPLPVTKLKFTFTVLTGGQVNEFLGSSIRGALGRILKEMVCKVDPKTNCNNCFYKSRCVYSNVFEPLRSNFKVTSSKLSNQAQIPAPLIIGVESYQTLAKNEYFSFDLSLVGEITAETKSILLNCFSTLTLFAKQPIKLRLLNVEQVQPFSWIDAEKPIQIKLKSPLQIKKNGQILRSQHFDLVAFLTTLIRRVKTLCLFYGDQLSPELENLWRSAVANISLLDTNLTDITWNRYSFKQKKSVPMQGVFGNLMIAGSGMKTLLPLLQLGEQIHVGKGSFMGLGRYQIAN
jgi:hypothetical protein